MRLPDIRLNLRVGLLPSPIAVALVIAFNSCGDAEHISWK